jgi:hypothetical protein
MTTARSKSVVTLALGALVVAFAISFGIGKLTKKSTTAAAPPKTHIVSLSSQKPAVPHFEGGGSIPALKATPKPAVTKTSTSGSGATSGSSPNSGSSESPREVKPKAKQKEKPKKYSDEG